MNRILRALNTPPEALFFLSALSLFVWVLLNVTAPEQPSQSDLEYLAEAQVGMEQLR